MPVNELRGASFFAIIALMHNRLKWAFVWKGTGFSPYKTGKRSRGL